MCECVAIVIAIAIAIMGQSNSSGAKSTATTVDNDNDEPVRSGVSLAPELEGTRKSDDACEDKYPLELLLYDCSPPHVPILTDRN